MHRGLLAGLVLLGACVDDPSTSAGDLATMPLDLLLAGPGDLPTPAPTLTWEKAQQGITGIHGAGLVTISNHFVALSVEDGAYHLAADGPLAATRLFEAPGDSTSKLMGVGTDNALLVSTISSVMQRLETGTAWSTFGSVGGRVVALAFLDRVYASYNKTLFRSAALSPPGSFAAYAVLSGTAQQIVPTSITGAQRLYLNLQNDGGTLRYVEPGTSSTVQSSVSGLASVATLGGGARVLAAGPNKTDGMPRVMELQANGSWAACGSDLASNVATTLVTATTDYNYLVTLDRRVWVNQGCTGPWTLGAPFTGAFTGLGITTDGSFNQVLAVATTSSLMRSSDNGQTWQDVPIQAASVQVDRILVNPGDSHHLVATTVGRGVFESTNQGAQWTRIEGLPTDDIEWQGVFREANVLLLFGRFLQLGGAETGGVFEATRSPTLGTYSIKRLGATSAPSSAMAGVYSSTIGVVACFVDPVPVRRLVGDVWQTIPTAADGSCNDVSASSSGLVFVGHLGGNYSVISDGQTASVRNLGLNTAVNTVRSVDGTADNLLLATGNGLFRVETNLVGEVLFDGASFDSVGGLWFDGFWWWARSSNEPLLRSDDAGKSWKRVSASTGSTPPIFDLLRIDNQLFAGGYTSVWKAQLW